MIYRKFISFMLIALFAVCAAFNVPAESPPKIVKFKVKAEKVAGAPATKTAASNFVRTDALVFYENLLPSARTAVMIVRYTGYARKGADSLFLKQYPQFEREIQFIYV